MDDTEVESAGDGATGDALDLEVVEPTDADASPQRDRDRRPKQRRRWPWVVVVILLTGLLATSIAMTYEATVRSQEWSDQVDSMTQTSYELGEQIAQVTTENVHLNDQIDLLESQLSNAKDTVLQLSDEKAQWRDDTEFAQQQVELTEELLSTAGTVSNGLQRCADGQQQLMVTLAAAPDYTPEELEAYQESVIELCDNAEKANTALQAKLAE